MPRYTILFIFLFLSPGTHLFAQKPAQSLPSVDTTFTDYDLLFSELDHFIDSISAPRSFTLVNIGLSNGYFNYKSKSSTLLDATKQLLYSPSISYFSKNGLGLSATASIVNDGKKLNPYQLYLTGSYDYLKNRKFITGLSYTRYFEKDSLPFYTSPLTNDLYAYFTYRKLWFKPSVTVSYGWGTRSNYAVREEYITSLRLRPTGYTKINTSESISDFNVSASIRHDFYWLNVISKKDYVRLTPQISFASGTQQFGFNQTSNTYGLRRNNGANVLYGSDNVYLDNQLYFQPLSLATYLKGEYSIGKFFIQPQIMVNYYFPAKEDKLSTGIVMNAGVVF
jgi:hypothetical protein